MGSHHPGPRVWRENPAYDRRRGTSLITAYSGTCKCAPAPDRLAAAPYPVVAFAAVKPSFVTWQLRRLHAELDAIDRQRGDVFSPVPRAVATTGRYSGRDRAARVALLGRILRSLPKRLGFRDARTFVRAFESANALVPDVPRRRRLSPAQVRELERRVLDNESPRIIAREIGCAEQTVLNRATQLRKRLATIAEHDGTGI